jgi:hypothetical protein
MPSPSISSDFALSLRTAVTMRGYPSDDRDLKMSSKPGMAVALSRSGRSGTTAAPFKIADDARVPEIAAPTVAVARAVQGRRKVRYLSTDGDTEAVVKCSMLLSSEVYSRAGARTPFGD